MRGRVAIAGTGALALLAGCLGREASERGAGPPDPGLEGLAVTQLAPTTIVPGTRLVVTGAAFVDFHTLAVAIDGDKLAELGGDADFHGTATIEVVAATDHQAYQAAPLAIDLALRTQLAPAPAALVASRVLFVNDEIEVDGDGFLLGGDEGATVARLAGCFTPQAGGACRPLPMVELPVVPASRTRASFAFSPRVAGIEPGSFTGTVTIVNQQPAAAPLAAAPLPAAYELVTPQVFSIDPPAASLGQYVFVHGGGFLGGEPGALTELELAGTFTRAGAAPVAVTMTLIPEFTSGRLVRYVVSTDDTLGRTIDLRADTATFTGTVTPVVSYGQAEVRGQGTQVSFAIAPVKQVVYLQFETSYIEGLRDFGLRAVAPQIRDRILAACREAYRGVNIEFRTEPPADFALYETVELVGIDPNDQGLFGYDNSPGKDTGNLRLYDRLGGAERLAQTQQDGYPGFGGVFVRSLMGFSQHPGSFARSVIGADPVFDQVFDPLRADRGGQPVTSADLVDAAPPVTDGTGCPAKDRAQQIQCAIYVLGNLVGGTLAHEIGHSLGLANPYQDGFHDAGDAPRRLMDAGDARPFLERASLLGQGPEVFCDDEYAYLRKILPSPDPADATPRPGCS